MYTRENLPIRGKKERKPEQKSDTAFRTSFTVELLSFFNEVSRICIILLNKAA
jgi:hypothetical protein